MLLECHSSWPCVTAGNDVEGPPRVKRSTYNSELRILSRSPRSWTSRARVGASKEIVDQICDEDLSCAASEWESHMMPLRHVPADARTEAIHYTEPTE